MAKRFRGPSSVRFWGSAGGCSFVHRLSTCLLIIQIFGPITNSVGSGLFGQATTMLSQSCGRTGLNSLYSIGGPRSIQLALKSIF
jgi:hypothetical protein